MAGARIVADGWAYAYPGRVDPVLADVSLVVEPGQLVVLMGASGSGKSTLLAALAGTLPDSGLGGAGTGRLEVRRAVRPGSAEDGPVRIGLVQQEPEANLVMERVGDDVAFPLTNAAVPADQIWPRVGAALAEVGLGAALERGTGQLSGGQQQLLAVAGAAVADPGLLLLDEPTANLDPGAAAAVLVAVARLRAARGCTVLVVEHRVEPWLAQADRVLLVEKGTVRDLDPADLRAHLAARPESAARIWLDHEHLPARPPVGAQGHRVLVATDVAVAGRLAATSVVAVAGEVVALTGAPGTGKSTLLWVLGGLLAPTTGTVDLPAAPEPGANDPAQGDAAQDLPAAARRDPWDWPAAEVAATFGVVFQNPEHQFVTGRVLDEVHHGLAAAGVPEPDASQRAGDMLDRLHLADLADRNPFTLSGGEQRRLSVGTALALDPGILLLDEPTFGQDPTTWAQVVGIIADHRDAGGTVILATHDPALVAALTAREVRMGSTSPGAAAPESPVQAEPATGLRSLDPLALVGGAMLLSVAGLVSRSVPWNLVVASFAVLVALLGGLPLRRVALLAGPAVLACASVALSNALLSDAGITSAAAWAAAALPASRVLAVALPGLVAAVAVDPTRLADALVVRLRVPARAAYSVLAGLRLLPLLVEEWAVLGRASRARGLAGRGVRARASRFASMTFRLLVAALRRGGRLAVALDTRGLAAGPRTVARPVRWRGPDTVALVVAAGAVAVAGIIGG